uniref:Myb-like domain-containing protein n=1 Tax=Davidia involucrata TaxID=16924 RepID=A0A5B7B5S1_DAVIN
MPQRNSTNRKQLTIALRRSPRLLQKVQSEPEYPKTPNPKLRTNRVHHSDPSSLSSTQMVSLKKTRKHFPEEIPKKVKESDIGSRSSANSTTGLRRSARLNDRVEEQFVGKTEKRVTRSSNKGNAMERVEKTSNDDECTSIEFLDEDVLSDVEGTKVGANLCEQFVVKLEKRKTRSSLISSVVTEGGREEREIDKGRKEIGVKRKRNQVGEGHEIIQGWTKDQELVLQRAYLAAKPTPHFWKKVAKLVPGKSAQDCFDKVYSDHLTPHQPRPHSRANRTNSSPLSLLAGKLLTSAEPKIKRPTCSKQKSHLAQKTVRQLLQKHYQVDQDYEADLFSVLESTLNQSTQAFQQGAILSTPECGKERPGFIKRCRERSSSARKKHRSRLSSLSGATLVSPPVLKQVKNKALHEKYIDQLHKREAKRKTASSRAAKSIPGKEDKESHIQKLDAIKAAKNALVLDARDVINQFQHSQANAMGDFSDIDDGIDGDDDDEGEDGP